MAPAFACLACGHERATPVYEQVPDYFLPTGIRVDYVRCTACELVQQFPVPEDVGPFYAAYPVHGKKSFLHEVTRRLVLKPVYFDLASLRNDHVLLDYGCGDGWFLDQAKSRVATAYGFEPTAQQAARVAENVGVQVFDNAAAMKSALAGKVDVITMHFVLEHLTDLKGTFALLSSLLKPGGILRAVVPNLDNIEYRVFRSRWHGFDAPRHISFPTPAQLKPVLDSVGLHLADDRFVPFPNTLAASFCIALTGRYRPFPFLAFLPLAILWSRLYPRGTRAMTFVNHE